MKWVFPFDVPNPTDDPPEAVPWPREAVIELSGPRLGEIASGTPVRITGIARPPDGGTQLISPVEQRACIGYRLVVEEPGWSRVVDRGACAPFLLNSDGVDLLVRGPFSVRLSAPYKMDFGEDIQQRLTRAVDGQGSGNENYRYFEAHVLSGMTIVVEGVASVEVDPGGDRATLRDAPIRRAVIASAGHPVLVSQPPEDFFKLGI